MDEVSRREFLATAAAVGATAAFPYGPAGAGQPQATYRRRNLSGTDPETQRAIASYKNAIWAMLALPPSDPCNWYRIALTHSLDCVHGNWWFFVWHRGYLGWFEQICRKQSGDPNFALPYWDWTAESSVPAVMFEDVLDPNNPAFISKFDDFETKFRPVIEDYWTRLTPKQFVQLVNRGIRFPDDLWFDIHKSPLGKWFFEPPIARGLTRENPDLSADPDTYNAVAEPTLFDALAPRDFITFASPKTWDHHGLTGFGVLEGSPHNMVHDFVGGRYFKPETGGFMQNFLSPVDPLFFLHHANIDRIWDVWTRKQQLNNDPILPDKSVMFAFGKSDLEWWSEENFLFFVNPDGQPVSEQVAGDYAAIGKFDYDYEPGSGEKVVQPKPSNVAAGAPIQRFGVQITPVRAGGSRTVARVVIPAALLEAQGEANSPKLFAKVLLAASSTHNTRFKFLVGQENGQAPDLNPQAWSSSDHNAGVFAIFGHRHIDCPLTFTVPLSKPIRAMRSSKTLLPNEPVDIQVVTQMPSTPGAFAPPNVTTNAEVLSIIVEAH